MSWFSDLFIFKRMVHLQLLKGMQCSELGISQKKVYKRGIFSVKNGI